MARKRASMREGPLAELFRATEAAQRGQTGDEPAPDAARADVRRGSSRRCPARARRARGAAAPARDAAAGRPGAVARPRRDGRARLRLRGRQRRERRGQPEPAASAADEAPTTIERVPAPAPRRAGAVAARARPRAAARRGRAAEPTVEPYTPPASRFVNPMPESPPRLHVAGDVASYLAVIRVVGVGGAGINAVNRMMDAGIAQVDFVAVNTDAQQLELSDAPVKLHIGESITQGLGSGSDPETGGAPARRATTRSARRSAAATWSSSPPARVVAPAPARHRSWRRSPASSAR